MSEYNIIQQIKRQFFAMRNGIVADTLRKSGLDYKIIFGLNLPQIVEIAAGFKPSRDLAEELWADRRTRESLLLAPMLYPREELSERRAGEMLTEAPTIEVADILCHRLLRHHPLALTIATEAATSSDELTRYGAFRLMNNLLHTHHREIKPFAEAELASASHLTAPLCRSILSEIEFIS